MHSLWPFQFGYSYLQGSEDNYHRYVNFVSYESDGDDLIAQIQLDDGTCWKFVSDAYDQGLLYQFQNDMQNGQEVYLEILDNTKLFLMTVKSQEYSFHCDQYLVELSFESLKLVPQIIKIEKFSKPKNGKNEDKYGYKITLSDGSIWKIIKFPSLVKDWKVGDKVIITSWLFKHWVLLNINAPFYEGTFKTDYRDSPFGAIYVGRI